MVLDSFLHKLKCMTLHKLTKQVKLKHSPKVINYGEGGGGGGLQNGNNFLRSPPPFQDRVKLVAAPTPHPPSVPLRLQAPMLKLPQNLLFPPSALSKLFVPPLFIGVKLRLPPFCSPPPLLIISDHSLLHLRTFLEFSFVKRAISIVDYSQNGRCKNRKFLGGNDSQFYVIL